MKYKKRIDELKYQKITTTLSKINKNLKEEIEKGNFREDLLHRLNVIPIVVPPLRRSNRAYWAQQP